MKRQVFVVLASLTLFLVSVHAQQSGTIIVAHIPFDFVVRDKTLPAGDYTVTRAAQGVLMIRSRDCKASMVFNTNTVESTRTRNELIFHRYGSRYFLSRVWTASSNTGGELKKCRTERDLTWAKISKAAGEPELETVSVLALQR